MTSRSVDLKARIFDDMKSALRAKDKPRLTAIRLILADIQQQEVDTRSKLNDSQIVIVLDKMAKQRREALDQYRKAGREDLAAREQLELDVISEYLPPALSELEIESLIEAAIIQTSAANVKDMSKVMGKLKPQLQGRAEMASVSALVKARLLA